MEEVLTMVKGLVSIDDAKVLNATLCVVQLIAAKQLADKFQDSDYNMHDPD